MTQAIPPFALLGILHNPASLADLGMEDLAAVISQARIARLLASLAMSVQAEGVLESIPWPARRHLLSAITVHQKQMLDLEFDSASIERALADIDVKLVVLKGGAYMLSQLPVGRGRLITDIDIIVPAANIDAAERTLNDSGWESSELDPYNENYYRRWSHEVPALINHKRGTTLDLHHNILPPTAGPDIDADLLFSRLREARPGIYTLCYPDMVLHSATHLFHEGEFHHGLRDLWDLDRMLRDFPAREPGFWDDLVARAQQLDLEQSLFHCLTYTQLLFQTPVPDSTLAAVTTSSRRLRRSLMDVLFIRAFRPQHPACRLPGTRMALNLLYLRSHYLRMPLYLLLPHLVRKAWMRRTEKGQDTLDQP